MAQLVLGSDFPRPTEDVGQAAPFPEAEGMRHSQARSHWQNSMPRGYGSEVPGAGDCSQLLGVSAFLCLWLQSKAIHLQS